jgi:FHA domain
MAAQYLDEYVRELGREGEKAFRARHPDPVIIVTRATGEAADAKDSGERTLISDTSGWRMPELSLIDRVFAIKRGAFEKEGPISLGRTDQTDLTIADKSVSKRHCVFEVAADGVHLTDLGSTNGTSVNGEPLVANTPRVLQGGETIDIGNFAFLFQTPDQLLALLRSRG